MTGPTPPTLRDPAVREFVDQLCNEISGRVVSGAQQVASTLGGRPPDLHGLDAGARAATALLLADLPSVVQRLQAALAQAQGPARRPSR